MRKITLALLLIFSFALAGCPDTDDDRGTNGESNGDATTDGDGDNDGDNETNGTAPSTPAEVELTPQDGWLENHADVEIPDTPGRAVFVIDGQRVEMQGDCSGGPNTDRYEYTLEQGQFEGNGVYFLADAIFEADDENFERQYALRVFNRVVAWSSGQLTYLRSNRMEFLWPGVTNNTALEYTLLPDGSTRDQQNQAVNFVDTNFLSWDSNGIITATGTLHNIGTSEFEPGQSFTFGARCNQAWIDRYVND